MFKLLQTKTLLVAALQVKYKQKYEKEKGHYMPVQDTPQILHAKAVRTLASEVSFSKLFVQLKNKTYYIKLCL